MSQRIRTRLQVLSLVTMTALTVGGWIWVFAGDRRLAMATFDQHESRIRALEVQQHQDANDLAEIRTDVRWIRHILEKHLDRVIR